VSTVPLTTTAPPEPPLDNATPDAETIQLRTLCSRTGKPIEEVRRILRAAGINKGVEGKPLYPDSHISVSDANRALAPPTPLSQAAAAGAATVPAPAPTHGTGNEDDPIPEAILTGEAREESGWPKVTHPDPEQHYHWINKDPRRVQAMHTIGYRFITRKETALRIRPDGLFAKMFDANGRVACGDTWLAQIPRAVWQRRKNSRDAQFNAAVVAAEDAARANIEEAKRVLRRKLGKGAEKLIDYLEMDADEAEDRADFQKRGKPRKARVDLGS